MVHEYQNFKICMFQHEIICENEAIKIMMPPLNIQRQIHGSMKADAKCLKQGKHW